MSGVDVFSVGGGGGGRGGGAVIGGGLVSGGIAGGKAARKEVNRQRKKKRRKNELQGLERRRAEQLIANRRGRSLLSDGSASLLGGRPESVGGSILG